MRRDHAQASFANRESVEREHPVAETMLDQLCPLRSIALIAAFRFSSGCLPRYTPPAFAFSIPCRCRLRLDLPGFCGERLAHFPGLSLEGDGALEAER